MAIDKLNKIRSTSPDEIVKRDLYEGATLAAIAHVNHVNDKLSEVIDELNTLSLEGYQGVIDCSGNPNYPAGNKDWYWRVSVAGKIGGASGIDVEVGDQVICIVTSVGGTQAAVGTSYMIVERNIQVGPAPTPVVRTNNPIVGTNPINTNIDALDAAIGVTPTSVNYVAAASTVNANISVLDGAAYTLNQRANHIMDPVHIIKHVNMAVIEHDFDTDPVTITAGGTTTINCNTGIDMLPANAIIKKVYYEIDTDIDSILQTSTIAVQTDTAVALVAAITTDGSNAGIDDGEQDGTAANMDKVAAACGIDIVCTETGGVYGDDITVGTIKVFIEYVLGI